MAEHFTVEDEKNYWVIEAESPRIRTLEELIQVCEIDLDTWEIERHVINKWEVGVKHKVTSQVIVSPLYQVKAWMIRKELLPVHPVLQPVIINVDIPDVLSSSKYNTWRSAIYLPDPQFGFTRNIMTGELDPLHDRRALDVALQITNRGHFDDVVWGGDIQDLAEWTDRFLKSPEFILTTQPSINECAWWMGQFKAAKPNAKHYLIEGNHEYRMRAALVTHLLAAHGLKPAHSPHVESSLSIPTLLGLEELGIKWVEGYPDSRIWLSERLCMEHGDVARKDSGSTGRAMLESGPRSVMFGHIHRQELVCDEVKDRGGHWTKYAACPGCLCRIDGKVPGHKYKQGWQQGVGIVHYDGMGDQRFEIIPIRDGKAYYKGRVIKARQPDGLRELREETGFKY